MTSYGLPTGAWSGCVPGAGGASASNNDPLGSGDHPLALLDDSKSILNHHGYISTSNWNIQYE
jgi:hypothetical protein